MHLASLQIHFILLRLQNKNVLLHLSQLILFHGFYPSSNPTFDIPPLIAHYFPCLDFSAY